MREINKRYYYGLASFENYWEEELESVTLSHKVKSRNIIFGDHSRLETSETFNNVPMQGKLIDVFPFKYEIGVENSYDYWEVHIRTKSGREFKSKPNFSCAIRKEDKGRVIMGVNAQSLRCYLAFPASGGCSTPMFFVYLT